MIKNLVKLVDSTNNFPTIDNLSDSFEYFLVINFVTK